MFRKWCAKYGLLPSVGVWSLVMKNDEVVDRMIGVGVGTLFGYELRRNYRGVMVKNANGICV